MINLKLFKSILIGTVMLMAGLLWLTKTEARPSMSAYANATNVAFYIYMHISASWLFVINAIDQNRWFDYILALGMGSILALDMYNYPVLHNIVTGLTLGGAVFSMIFFSSARNLSINIFLGSVAAGIFLLGFWGPVHLFLAEALAMLCISVHMLRRIHIKRDA